MLHALYGVARRTRTYNTCRMRFRGQTLTLTGKRYFNPSPTPPTSSSRPALPCPRRWMTGSLSSTRCRRDGPPSAASISGSSSFWCFLALAQGLPAGAPAPCGRACLAGPVGLCHGRQWQGCSAEPDNRDRRLVGGNMMGSTCFVLGSRPVPCLCP